MFHRDSQIRSLPHGILNDCNHLSCIVIPKRMLRIEDYCFYNCHSLKEIVFDSPSKLNYIGAMAMVNTALKRIHIPDDVREIKTSCFQGIASLEAVTFGEGSKLEIIDTKAFFCCSSLREIAIPAGVKSVGYLAFSGCAHLETLEFMENSELVEILGLAFEKCALFCVTIPAQVTTIHNYAFRGNRDLVHLSFESGSKLETLCLGCFRACGMKRVEVPSSVKVIGRYAFYACKELTYVKFADNSQLIAICEHAFSRTAIKEIAIPGSTMKVGNAFRGCLSLQWVCFVGSSALDIYAYENLEYFDVTTLRSAHCDLFYNHWDEADVKVTLPDSLQILLRCVNCWDNLEEIETGENSNLRILRRDSLSLSMLPNLKRLVIAGGTPLYAIESDVFGNCMKFEEQDGKFVCGSVELVLPFRWELQGNVLVRVSENDHTDTVNVDSRLFTNSILSPGMFRMDRLCVCYLPDAIKRISTRTFWGFSKFEKCVIGDHSQLEVIETEAFAQSGIRKFECLSNTLKEIHESAFRDSKLEEFVVSASLCNIPPKCFKGCRELKEVKYATINSCLTVIGEQAFADCPKLQAMIIPKSVISIDDWAFFMCAGLSSVTFELESQLERIGQFAFALSGIKELVYPDNVTAISHGSCAFCPSLRKVVFGKNLKEIENRPFVRCMNLKSISFQKCAKIVYIGAHAFSDTGIEELIIPASIEEIEVGCFSGCFNLKSVIFERDKMSIIRLSSGCFSYCQIGVLDFGNRVIQFTDIIRYPKDPLSRRGAFMCSRIGKICMDTSCWSDRFGWILDGTYIVDDIHVRVNSELQEPYHLCRYLEATGFHMIKRKSNVRIYRSINLESRESDMVNLELTYIGDFLFYQSTITHIRFDKSVDGIGEYCINKLVHCIEYDTFCFEVGSDRKWVPRESNVSPDEQALCDKLNSMCLKGSSLEFKKEVDSFLNFWRPWKKRASGKDVLVQRKDVPYMKTWDSNFAMRISSAGLMKIKRLVRKRKIQERITNGEL